MSIDIQKFSSWLQARGCEILPPTNEYEAVRFKGKKIGVLYKSGKCSNMFTCEAIKCFQSGSKWDGHPVNVGRHNTYKKEKVKLLERDGDCCFLCGKTLGDDITVEHLIALSSGGSNSLANMVLMHEACNNEVGNMLVVDKVKLAIKNRTA